MQSQFDKVTPRKRRVSRNWTISGRIGECVVTPRKRRVSRNSNPAWLRLSDSGHASQEACE